MRLVGGEVGLVARWVRLVARWGGTREVLQFNCLVCPLPLRAEPCLHAQSQSCSPGILSMLRLLRLQLIHPLLSTVTSLDNFADLILESSLGLLTF